MRTRRVEICHAQNQAALHLPFAPRTHVYGTGNLYYDFEDGTSMDVAGTPAAR